MAVEFGYSGKLLKVDLSSSYMTAIPTAHYADKYIGGRGIAAAIYWNEVSAKISAFHPENRLIFITGPLAGLSGVSGSRWEICGKSPASDPEHFSYCNLGGRWGAQLKFAGYDGIIIHGKSETPVYLLVHDGNPELRDASALWGKTSVDARTLLKGELGSKVAVLAIGPAGENLVSMATILAEEDSSGSGLGSVMGSKNLKAIAILGESSRPTVAYPEKLRELTSYIRELKLDRAMRFLNWPQWPLSDGKIKQQRCYGCVSGCHRATYESADGDKGKFFCQAAGFYQPLATSYYGEQNEVPFQATRLCDKYGLDTEAIEGIIEWLSRCYNAGILSDESTGIPLSKLGSKEFIETLVRKISLRDGFGDILAHGIYRAANSIGGKAKEMIGDNIYKAGQTYPYGGRIYITTGLLYAMEPRLPIQLLHEITRSAKKWRVWLNRSKEGAYLSGDVLRGIATQFLGSENAFDFSTYKGKALAAKRIQDHEYAIECLILCNKLFPIMDNEQSDDHIGDPSIESRLYSAVTGNQIDEEGLYRIGERVFNLQRAILVREGHRGRDNDRLPEFDYTVPIEADRLNPDCLVPGKNAEPISRKGAVVDREKYEGMLDEYYHFRGWDTKTGLQTKVKLRELNLEEIAVWLEHEGFIGVNRQS